MQLTMNLDKIVTQPDTTSNDYYKLPITEKQLNYARHISIASGNAIPWEVQQDRNDLSRWIDVNKAALKTSKFANYPSSKQVAFAERVARLKRRQVPHECFKDRTLMSRWIDSNL